ALAKLWDVEDTDLLNLLAIEEKLTIIDRTLQLLLENHDSSFGGTYINIKAKKVFVNTVDFTVMNNITDSSEIKNGDYVNFINFIPANNSMTTLKFRFNSIFNLIKQYKPISIQLYIDMELNNVVIRHLEENIKKNELFIKFASQYEPTFIRPSALPNSNCQNQKISQTRISNRDLITHQILNGDGIYNNATGGLCSAAFLARSNNTDNPKYIVTAGHCSDQFQRFSNVAQLFYHYPWGSEKPLNFLGKMIESENIDFYDFGLIELTDNYIEQSTQHLRNSDSNQYVELFAEGGKNITSHGVHLCKSGLTTHTTCGFVRGLNAVTINRIGFMGTDHILAGKDSFQMSCPGDSGACAFSYLQDLLTVSINGMLIQGFGDFSVYVPLNTILIKGGLELVRSPTPL
ncbi:9326_t:CDS:1, partial [Cetraspora pellucida]